MKFLEVCGSLLIRVEVFMQHICTIKHICMIEWAERNNQYQHFYFLKPTDLICWCRASPIATSEDNSTADSIFQFSMCAHCPLVSANPNSDGVSLGFLQAAWRRGLCFFAVQANPCCSKKALAKLSTVIVVIFEAERILRVNLHIQPSQMETLCGGGFFMLLLCLQMQIKPKTNRISHHLH